MTHSMLYSNIERGGTMSESVNETALNGADETAATAEKLEKAKNQEIEPEFRPGDVVVIARDFHSSYFRGLVGVVEGPGRKGGTAQTLYPLKIDVPPHHTLIPAKYLQLQSEAEEAIGAGSSPASSSRGARNSSAADRSRGSLLSRLFSRGK